MPDVCRLNSNTNNLTPHSSQAFLIVVNINIWLGAHTFTNTSSKWILDCSQVNKISPSESMIHNLDPILTWPLLSCVTMAAVTIRHYNYKESFKIKKFVRINQTLAGFALSMITCHIRPFGRPNELLIHNIFWCCLVQS